ncbi:MAG: AraC family transcriptional regulator [Lachnospiraceae bacterium]
MYHQPIHPLYDPSSHTISLNSHELIISYFDYHNENTVEFPHSHPKEFEFYFLTEGTMENLILGEIQTIQAGDFLFLSPGIQHGTLYKPEQKKSYITIVFSIQPRQTTDTDYKAEIAKKHIDAFFHSIHGRPYVIGKDEFHCADLVDDILREATTQEWASIFMLQFQYANFIFSLLRNFIPQVDNVSSKADSQTTLPIAFTKYLHANYQNKELNLQDIANYFYITPRHLNRLFKEYFNASVAKTLTLYRISYAKNYLLDTAFSVEEIADKVGFSSASTLSRLFKEYEGITISEYRYLCKQQKLISQNASKKRIP